MHVNLVYWNSLHPKTCVRLVFFFSTYGLGSNIYKKWCNNVVNTLAAKYTLYLVRPHTVSVLGKDKGCMVKYSLCLREILKAKGKI